MYQTMPWSMPMFSSIECGQWTNTWINVKWSKGGGRGRGAKKTQRPKVSMWRRQLYSCHSHVVCLCEPLSDSFEMHRKKNCKQTMSMSMWRWGCVDVKMSKTSSQRLNNWGGNAQLKKQRTVELLLLLLWCYCLQLPRKAYPKRWRCQSSGVIKAKKTKPVPQMLYLYSRYRCIYMWIHVYIYCGSRSFCCDGCSKFWHSDLSHTHGEKEREG